VDRTYLDTRFSSLKGIARIAVEGPLDKVTIAGMAQLLKEVRRGPGEISRHTPIYFVSGSPAQLRGVIERKLLLDGVEFDGTSFKDWTGLLKRGRWTGLKRQLAFKLAALLGNRALLPPGSREILLGDDLEVDPLVYALYADILAGRIPPGRLPGVLLGRGLSAGEVEGLVGLKLRAGNQPGGVRRALIRLERSENPEALLPFAPWVVPCADAFQMALTLWDSGSLSPAGAVRVARSLRLFDLPPEHLERDLFELVRRGLLDASQVEEQAALLEREGLCRLQGRLPEVDPAWLAVSARSRDEPWTPGASPGR
jgi:hypothetical protein